MKLPNQSPSATKRMEDLNKVPFFQIGPQGWRFGFTQEDATVYFGPSERTDTCAWRGLSTNDILTRKFVEWSPWIEKRILERFRRLCRRISRSQRWDRPDVPYHRVVDIMDTLTCISASLLLTGAMFALVSIDPLLARIGAVGGFGTLFALAVKIMAGNPSRGEVFAATAAFFAVASVFVSNTGNGCGFQ